MSFDYTSMGFYTFDCLARPVTAIPPGGGTYLVDEFTLAVSGAAGSAAIVAAKHGLAVQAVGGVGRDDMGDWVLAKLGAFGVDTANMQRCAGYATSSSIVTTRPDGERPALHKKGATSGFYVDDAALDGVLDTKILHVGSVMMDRMDDGRIVEVMQAARTRGITTTLDVFTSAREDMARIGPLLPYTDYFLPSAEEATALSGLSEYDDVTGFLLDHGVGCVVLTLGADGVLYRHRDGTRFASPAYDIAVICSCGCGDCFNAGFATGLHMGLPAGECVRLGQAASAQNATGLGSQAGVASLAATREFMANTPLKTYIDEE